MRKEQRKMEWTKELFEKAEITEIELEEVDILSTSDPYEVPRD